MTDVLDLLSKNSWWILFGILATVISFIVDFGELWRKLRSRRSGLHHPESMRIIKEPMAVHIFASAAGGFMGAGLASVSADPLSDLISAGAELSDPLAVDLFDVNDLDSHLRTGRAALDTATDILHMT